ncbi:MAG: hypothetical protein AAF296_02945 [Pseudomonadota bacterium]
MDEEEKAAILKVLDNFKISYLEDMADKCDCEDVRNDTFRDMMHIMQLDERITIEAAEFERAMYLKNPRDRAKTARSQLEIIKTKIRCRRH